MGSQKNNELFDGVRDRIARIFEWGVPDDTRLFRIGPTKGRVDCIDARWFAGNLAGVYWTVTISLNDDGIGDYKLDWTGPAGALFVYGPSTAFATALEDVVRTAFVVGNMTRSV